MKDEAILIHGWDPNYYNSQVEDKDSESIAWSHRSEFTNQLEEQFDLNYYNLPGFCGVAEPEAEKFDVENFTDGFAEWLKLQDKQPKLLIGYSFGGAILLDYKARYKDETPAVLISPAIFREETARSGVAKNLRPLIPQPLLNYFKHLYQLSISEYYRNGTPFLRRTYDIVVRRDLRSLLKKVDPGGMFLIYGTNDDATPWDLVKKSVEKSGIDYHLIAGGQHGIGQTHPDEIIQSINNFLQKEK